MIKRTGFSCSTQTCRRLYKRKSDIAKNLKCRYAHGYFKVSNGSQTESEVLYSKLWRKQFFLFFYQNVFTYKQNM